MSGSAHPTLPPEFFSIAELVGMLGPQRRAGLIKVLKDANVSFVVGMHGWPLVYRDKLLPTSEQVKQDGPPAQIFNFENIHAARRTSAQRR